MTRRNITTVLGSLLVGLLVALNVPAVSADGPCYTDGQGNCAVTTPSTATFSIASAGPAVRVPGIDYRFLEENTTTLPSAGVASLAMSSRTMGAWQFLEMNTITLPTPVSADASSSGSTFGDSALMVVGDGLVFQGQSVAPPANGVAITQTRETSCTMVPAPCYMP
jgi:hypothetical protein